MPRDVVNNQQHQQEPLAEESAYLNGAIRGENTWLYVLQPNWQKFPICQISENKETILNFKLNFNPALTVKIVCREELSTLIDGPFIYGPAAGFPNHSAILFYTNLKCKLAA